MNKIKLSPTAIQDLEDIPDLGIPLQKYVNFKTDYRFILVNNYSIFYRFEDETIFVIRILYSKRDFLKVLFG